MPVVSLLVLDVDGVLTDGRIYYGPKGEALQSFHVRDGHGIRQVLAAGITVMVISGRKSPGARRRCRELGIKHIYQGVNAKLECLLRYCRQQKIALAQVAAIGDDSPDAPLLAAVGHPFAVADAHADAKRAANRRTRARGGEAAVREVCDWLLKSRG